MRQSIATMRGTMLLAALLCLSTATSSTAQEQTVGLFQNDEAAPCGPYNGGVAGALRRGAGSFFKGNGYIGREHVFIVAGDATGELIEVHDDPPVQPRRKGIPPPDGVRCTGAVGRDGGRGALWCRYARGNR